MIRRRLCALVALLGLGSALADPAPQLPDREPVYLRLRDLAEEAATDVTKFGKSTPGKIVGETTRTLTKGGKFIKYGGNFLFAASLVNDAMHWFYDEAKKSTGTDLDTFWGSGGTMPATIHINNYEGEIASATCKGSNGYPRAIYRMLNHPYAYAIVQGGGYLSFVTFNDSLDALKDSLNSNCGAEKALSDYLNRPGVPEAMRDVISQYIDKHPNAPRPFLDAPPNDNQYDDNPYSDETLDTDGDGFPDSKEHELNTDPNDPNSHPTGDKDKVVKVTTRTTRNPDGSTVTVKEITYGDGSKRRITTTVKTTVKDNGDGTQTKTTTTTTKTENLNPDGSNKTEPKEETKVEEETEPKEDPAKDEKECTSRGGTWDDSTSTCQDEKPCPVGYDRIDGKCEDKKKDTPVSDTCGDMSLARATKYLGSWLKDVVVPCDDLGDLFAPLSEAASTKFPFSLTSKLNNMVTASGSAQDMSGALPSQLGPFKLDWSQYKAVILTIGLLFKAVISWIGINVFISRMSGQVVIK